MQPVHLNPCVTNRHIDLISEYPRTPPLNEGRWFRFPKPNYTEAPPKRIDLLLNRKETHPNAPDNNENFGWAPRNLPSVSGAMERNLYCLIYISRDSNPLQRGMAQDLFHPSPEPAWDKVNRSDARCHGEIYRKFSLKAFGQGPIC